MKTWAAVILLLLPWGVTPARAHRLDELLQATLLSVGQDRVTVQLCLTPGSSVFRRVLADVDLNGDGLLSDGEQRAFAERVVGELSLAVDNTPLRFELVSWLFPSLDVMQAGQGGIVLGLTANVPPGHSQRKLVFENRYQREISAYLVNCLTPADHQIHPAAQTRSEDQSRYQLDYTQDGGWRDPSLNAGPAQRGWLLAGTSSLAAGLMLWWFRRGSHVPPRPSVAVPGSKSA